MGKSQKTILIVVGLLVLFIIIPYSYLKGTYNSLVTMDETVKGAWAQVENQLQRRYDLIPNYVETVKGYAAHEKEVFVKVTEARSKVAGAANISEKMQANNQLTSALSRLMVVVERYPELKANTNFIRLQDELAGTENRIAVERRNFNNTVQGYNATVRQFPRNIIAGILGFGKKGYFESTAGSENVPDVSFE